MPLQQKNDDGLTVAGEAVTLDELREQICALERGGINAECEKLFEANVRRLYVEERWPDVFFEILRVYHRAVLAQGKSEGFEPRLITLLKQNSVPFVLAHLLREPEGVKVWNADRFRDLAVARERRSEFDAALSCIDLALKLEPENSMLHVQRGWLLDDLDRHDEAEEMFRKAIDLNASNHSAINSLAKHLAEKKPREALEFAENALLLSPAEGTYYDTKARILVRIGNREGAINCYDLAMEASPLSADFPYQKGELLLAMGKEMAAIAQYRKAMSLDEKHVPSLWRLATLYRESQPELALTYINTVASLTSDNQKALLFKAELLSRLGEEEAASVQFEEILNEDANCHEALAGRASLLVLTDPAAAIGLYDKAIKFSPKTASYHAGKARALENLGRLNQAVKEYRQSAALDPRNARILAKLGELLTEQKPREAADFFSKAIAIAPDNAYYHTAKAEALLKLTDGAVQAIACLNEALRLKPTDGHAHAVLAGLLESTGNAAGAVEHYKQAVKLDPKNADSFFRLARLILDTQPDMALLHINSALSLSPESSDYYCIKAKVLTVLGHNKQAIEHLRESLRASDSQDGGRNAETLRELAELTESESPKLALMYINRALEMEPKNAEYICTRAGLLFSTGEHKKALNQYNEALKLDSKSHDALLGVARCLSADGDLKAIGYFDRAIAIAPDMADCYAEKAALLAKSGRTGDAVTAYATAIVKDGGNWRYRLERARLLESAGRINEACGGYKDVIAITPECAQAVGRLGILLAESSPEEALPHLTRATYLFPDEYLYRAWRANALLALGENDAAAAEYIRAAKLGGETGKTYYTIADILWKKMPETALGFCLKAVAADNGNAGYRLLCGRIYIALREPDNAIEQFRFAACCDAKCHAAFEEILRILAERGSPDAFDAVNDALGSNPDCVDCLLKKALLLENNAENPDLDGALSCLERALKLSPELLSAREKLVEILEKKRNPVRLMLERRKLNKLKEKIGKAGHDDDNTNS